MARQCRAALEHPYESGHVRCLKEEGHDGMHMATGEAVWSENHLRHVEIPLDEDEVVERIVAWLRASRFVSDHDVADDIERGAWKAAPSPSEEKPK